MAITFENHKYGHRPKKYNYFVLFKAFKIADSTTSNEIYSLFAAQ